MELFFIHYIISSQTTMMTPKHIDCSFIRDSFLSQIKRKCVLWVYICSIYKDIINKYRYTLSIIAKYNQPSC